MRNSILYFICFLGITISSVYGQKTVLGRVVDKETGKPVKDAFITQIGTDIKTTSNSSGFFQLQIDSATSIEINADGYPMTQVGVPDVSSFRIELMKSPPAEKTYKIYEQPPSFPGGLEEFLNYIKKNIKNPKEVRNGKISGKVEVEFVIDSTGLIPPDEVKIKKGLCMPCDEEAIRLIKGSPKWNPGIQMDKPVRVRFTFPIMFK